MFSRYLRRHTTISSFSVIALFWFHLLYVKSIIFKNLCKHACEIFSKLSSLYTNWYILLIVGIYCLNQKLRTAFLWKLSNSSRKNILIRFLFGEVTVLFLLYYEIVLDLVFWPILNFSLNDIQTFLKDTFGSSCTFFFYALMIIRPLTRRNNLK